MTRSTLLQLVAVVLSLSAAYVSFKLLVKHVKGSSGVGWFDAGCASEEEGGADCDAVIKSKYGSFPFAEEGDPEDKPRIPVAFFGLLYYSCIAVWLLGIGRPTVERRHLHLLPLIVVGVGLLSSALFTYVMLTGLDNWCPWCIVTHVLNVLLAGCLVLLWPRRSAADASDSAGAAAGSGDDVMAAWFAPGARPTSRQALITVIAIFLVMYGEQQKFARDVRGRNLDECLAAVQSIKSDPRKMIRGWQIEPQYTFDKRSDDAARKAGKEARGTGLVIFSDFECPSCRSFAEFLDEEIQPLFDHNIDVLFRHYPLNQDCNPHVKTKMHAGACHLIRLAEAARIVGGTDAFWKAHDYLFANQRKHDKLTPEALVKALGIDPAAYARALQDDAIQKRIEEDTEEAQRVGVRSTPTVFVSGRKVEGVYRGSLVFWDALAEAYWRGIKKERPEHTKLKQKGSSKGEASGADVTPDSPNQTGAP
jgi:protein-disulfide isomerase/uncharacterized membrane protein